MKRAAIAIEQKLEEERDGNRTGVAVIFSAISAISCSNQSGGGIQQEEAEEAEKRKTCPGQYTGSVWSLLSLRPPVKIY